MTHSTSRSPRRSASLPAAACLVVLLWPLATPAQLVPCPDRPDAPRIAEALARLHTSVDPCGESWEIAALLDRLNRCGKGAYQICTSPSASRNLFDHAPVRDREPARRTITWNPDLRSELEARCAEDPGQPVRRDPTASLLHEIVHAVDDCEGRNPGLRELEAVRVENIYRRAAGLCQRSGYGDRLIADAVVLTCSDGRCACALRPRGAGPVRAQAEPVRPGRAAGDLPATSAVEPGR